MGFSDLEYGWYHEVFDLVDVSIHRSVELQERDDDGDWRNRQATFILSGTDTDKFENAEELRYSEFEGRLNGKAKPSDYMNQIILGVPKDKQDKVSVDQNRIDSIHVQIMTVPSDNVAECIKKGGSQFRKGNEFFDEGVYVRLCISKEHFAEICRAAAEPDVTFTLELNIKGWRWVGPIGDCKTYFKTDGFERAELASITVSRKLPNPIPEQVDLD